MDQGKLKRIHGIKKENQVNSYVQVVTRSMEIEKERAIKISKVS